jgi:glycerate dehydrogenase
MNIALLDADTLGSDLDLSPLEAFGDLEVYDITTPEETIDNIDQAEVVITNKVVIDRAIMEAAPALKLICVAATGMNNIDLDAAREPFRGAFQGVERRGDRAGSDADDHEVRRDGHAAFELD